VTRFVRRADRAGVIETRSAGDDEESAPSGSRVARLVGAAGLVVLTALLFWLLSDDGFRVDPADVNITGIRLADSAAVRDHISGIDRGPNVFRLRAIDIVEDLGALPEVAFARASVALPANVTVEVIEREPIFIWSNGGESWFVDGDGVLFSPRDETVVADAMAAARARLDESVSASAAPAVVEAEEDTVEPDDPSPTTPPQPEVAVTAGVTGAGPDRGADAALVALPVLLDARLVETPFVPGDRLPAIDFSVMRQLLGITPAFLGSQSNAVSLRIDERDGYVLRSEDIGWQAVFGHYRPTVQPPDVVSLQAQCLASLLASKPERRLVRVVLVPTEERCGTFETVKSRDPDA
jgi:hypothetical protein